MRRRWPIRRRVATHLDSAKIEQGEHRTRRRVPLLFQAQHQNPLMQALDVRLGPELGHNRRDAPQQHAEGARTRKLAAFDGPLVKQDGAAV